MNIKMLFSSENSIYQGLFYINSATNFVYCQIYIIYASEIKWDTQKDADFDYLRGSESLNIYQLAFNQYTINTQRLMRYAKRRSISQEIQELVNQTKWLAKTVSQRVGTPNLLHKILLSHSCWVIGNYGTKSFIFKLQRT